jgi:hypothetical protein
VANEMQRTAGWGRPYASGRCLRASPLTRSPSTANSGLFRDTLL